MFKRFIPFCHAKSIYDVNVQFFVRQNIKVLLMDLDNTLDSYKSFHPGKKTFALFEKLESAGIKPVIISNNKGKRVGSFAGDLNAEYVYSARKPFGKKIRQEMKKLDVNPENTMLVGDQLITDVLAGRAAKIRVMLTEKLVKEDQWTTRFNRMFDRPIRKYLFKKGTIIEWEDK